MPATTIFKGNKTTKNKNTGSRDIPEIERNNLPSVPEHLTELYEKSCQNLENEVPKSKLANILIKNQDAFARNKKDIGTCMLSYKTSH